MSFTAGETAQQVEALAALACLSESLPIPLVEEEKQPEPVAL